MAESVFRIIEDKEEFERQTAKIQEVFKVKLKERLEIVLPPTVQENWLFVSHARKDIDMVRFTFYNINVQNNQSRSSIISGNLYQLLSYVQNMKFELTQKGKHFDVVGTLLYAAFRNHSNQTD